MLFGNYVIHLVCGRHEILVQKAVFTAVPGALNDLLPQFGRWTSGRRLCF